MLAPDARAAWAARGGLAVIADRRRWVIGSVALILIAAGAVALAAEALHRGDGNRPGGNGSATSLATVTRRSLSQTTQFNGTLGYAGSYTVLGQAPGTVTWLPRVGRVVGQGQVLFRVDGAPVVLLYGSTPAWRALAAGAFASDVTGADVAQLNHDLVALGYVHKADVDSAWDEFSWATKAGVREAAGPPRGGSDRPAGPGGRGVLADRRPGDRAAGHPRWPGYRAGAAGEFDGAHGDGRAGG